MPRHAPHYQPFLQQQSLITPSPPPSPPPPSNGNNKQLEIMAISGLVGGVIIFTILFILWQSPPADHDHAHGESETATTQAPCIDQSNGTESRQQEMTKARLEALMPTVQVRDKNSDDDDCIICLEKFEDGDQCRVLPECNHVYHKTCIDAWLLDKNHCPLCRVDVWDRNFDEEKPCLE